MQESDKIISRLKDALSLNQVKQNKFAGLTGYGKSSISGFLSGTNPLQDRFVSVACQVLEEKYGVSSKWIKTGEGPMEAKKQNEEEVEEMTKDELIAELKKDRDMWREAFFSVAKPQAANAPNAGVVIEDQKKILGT